MNEKKKLHRVKSIFNHIINPQEAKRIHLIPYIHITDRPPISTDSLQRNPDFPVYSTIPVDHAPPP